MILAAAFIGAYMVGSIGKKIARDAKFQRQSRVQVWANERAHRQSDYERSRQPPRYEQQPPRYENLDIFQPPSYESIDNHRTPRPEFRSRHYHRRTRRDLPSANGQQHRRGIAADDETRVDPNRFRNSMISEESFRTTDESVRNSDARPKWKRRLLRSTRFRRHH